MSVEVLRELEGAAQVVLAPPNLISAEQRHSAEAVFINFHKTSSPYQLCRQILESSTVDYVLFETAGLIKTAIIREWSYMQWSDTYSLLEYLQHYVINRPTLALYVRAKVLQVIAILIKIISSHDHGEQRRKMLDMMETLIRKGDLPKRILGCNILSALLQEYAATVKSSDISQTWEWHHNQKLEFETTDIKRIFKFCVEMFVELTEKLMEEETLSVAKHLLAVAESILVWAYYYENVPDSVMNICMVSEESEDNPSLSLTSIWRDIMLDPVVLNVFFMVYLKIRNNLQIAHHAMNCIVQLASLHGSVFYSEDDKLKYLTNYMERFLTLVRSIDINNQEASGITTIIRKINSHYQRSLNSLPKALHISYVQEVTRLTCLFLSPNVQEESMYSDDPLYMKAVERMMATMLFEFFPTAEMCEMNSLQIFQSYIQYRLSPMPGTAESYGKSEANKEIAEVEEDDRIKFDNQLQTIGVFGRQAATYSLPLLTELFEKRIQKLCDNLNVLVGQENSPSRPDSMNDLYEELHWLVLIIGHVLCSCDELDILFNKELKLIPPDITRCSMEQSQNGQVDVSRTLEFLVSSQNVQLDLNRPICSIDHVIRLIAGVFRLCAIEKTLISLKWQNILSPELSSTITWFLRMISETYLLPNERRYVEISTTFLEIFGDDTPGASWIMDFLLDKVIYNINAFKSEPAIVQETINLLISLVESKTKASYLCKSEQFKNIIELATKGQYNCPQIVKRGLMRAVVEIGAKLRDTSSSSSSSSSSRINVKQMFCSQTLGPLQHRCIQLISSDHFMLSYHQEEIKVQIIDILESFAGITEGFMAKIPISMMELVFQHTYPILAVLPKLLSLYHNYQEIVQLILEIFCGYSKVIVFISEADSKCVLKVYSEVIQTYARCNSNRLTVDSTAEEDSYHDILLLMKLLTNLLSNGLLNIDEDHLIIYELKLEAESRFDAPTDVFFYGLSIIMPLITMDMLKFPSMCLQYFHMILSGCNARAQKVCSLPTKVLQQLLASVELGLYSFGHKATALCCDVIHALAKHIHTEFAKEQQCSDIMLPFLNSLINLTLTGQIRDSDVMYSVSLALYCLICCYNEQYTELVKNMIHGQTDSQVAKRLTDSFLLLTSNVEFNADTAYFQRTKFKENFEIFVTLVRGFLMIK